MEARNRIIPLAAAVAVLLCAVHGWTSAAESTEGRMPRRSWMTGSGESTEGRMPRAQDAQERPEARMAGAAAVRGPTGQIRGTIDRVIGILKRPDLKSQARARERRDLLRREIKPVFDFQEMSKRSLGPNWRERTPQEREAFVGLFTELLENAYIGKIDSYHGETINYVGETIDSLYAVVATVIVTSRGQEIPVDYRMLREGERWLIYDVVIEGVSLVNNYRSQFNGILRKSTFPEMMEKLRGTIRKQES